MEELLRECKQLIEVSNSRRVWSYVRSTNVQESIAKYHSQINSQKEALMVRIYEMKPIYFLNLYH